jgi:hypothetical protein
MNGTLKAISRLCPYCAGVFTRLGYKTQVSEMNSMSRKAMFYMAMMLALATAATAATAFAG